MRKSTLRKVLLFSCITALSLQACRKDDAAMMAIPGTPDQSFVEEFDTADAAYARGWRYINVSSPKGTGFWTQGMFNDPLVTGLPAPIPFNAYSSKGSNVGFIGADFTSTLGGPGTISNWVVSPVITMQNGDRVQFYTRGVLYFDASINDSTDYANRLQVRMSTANESLDVGSGNSAGDFKLTLLDINPEYKEARIKTYDPLSYPIRWTKFEAKIGGLNGPTKGRIAFRYYLEGGGAPGLGSGVGLDSVAYIGKH